MLPLPPLLPPPLRLRPEARTHQLLPLPHAQPHLQPSLLQARSHGLQPVPQVQLEYLLVLQQECL